MSVKFNFARVTCSAQINRFRESENLQFAIVELNTSGWKTGARNRTKTFTHPTFAQAYLIKLLDGGWMSQFEYNLANFSVSDLWDRFNDMEKFISCDAPRSSIEKPSCFSSDMPKIALELIPHNFKL